jgi:hypothetical protein
MRSVSRFASSLSSRVVHLLKKVLQLFRVKEHLSVKGLWRALRALPYALREATIIQGAQMPAGASMMKLNVNHPREAQLKNIRLEPS